MKQIRIEKLIEPQPDWAMRFFKLEDVSNIIDEPVEILGPGGEREIVLLRNGVSEENLRRAWFHLKDYNPSTNNRGTASGSSKLRLLKDGTESKTNIGETVNSGVIGFFDRYPRIPYCRKCSWNQQNPEKFETLVPLFKEIDNRFREVWPEKWAVNHAAAEKTHPDFVIPGTSFTTVTVNKNFRTACHQDARNLPGSISTMLIIHDGPLSGGGIDPPRTGHGTALQDRGPCVVREH